MKIAKWFFMLSKRLYKKPAFLVMLLLIPLCVGLFTLAARQDSGFVHIVLAREAADDPLAARVMAELLAEKGTVRFSLAATPEAALEAVGAGQADEAWLFPADTAGRVADFVTGRAEYIIRAVTLEETALLGLSREKLTSTLYKYCAEAYYIAYIRENIPQLDHLTDGELSVYFAQVLVSEELFLYGNPAIPADGEINYLTSPIRGLLAVLMLLCTMAATLFYMQDDARGTFSWVRQSRRGLTALGCVVTAGVNVAATVLAALAVSGLGGNFGREAAAILLYSLCCGAFCLLLKQIFPGIRAYGAVIPLVTVVLVGVCPVFMDLRKLQWLQLVFPPTYYINGIFDNKYIFYMLVYVPVCLLLAAVGQKVRQTLAINMTKR